MPRRVPASARDASPGDTGGPSRPGAAGRRRQGAASGPAERPSEPLTAGFIRSYALLWVLGLGFLWWPLLLVRTLRARARRSAPSFLPFAVAACLALSLLWAAVAGAPLSRVVSAAYNLTIWTTLVMLSRVLVDVRSVATGIAQLAGLQSVAVLAAMAVHPLVDRAPLPSSSIIPGWLAEDPAIESFTTVRLVIEDYFGGTVLRAAGLFGNSTWAGALAALGIVATIHLLTQHDTRRRELYAALLVLDVVVLYLSYSRNTWVAVVAALLAMAVRTLVRRGRWFAVLLVVTAGLGALVHVLTSVDLAAAFDEVNSVREGSLGSRTAIYAATWAAIEQHPFPLLGSGVKERVPGLVASLGTHSGYLGILYRGGWLALAALLVWLLALLGRSLRLGPPLALGSAVLATIWFIAEDVDAGHLVPLALVLTVAMTQQHPRTEPSSTGRGCRRREPVTSGSP